MVKIYLDDIRTPISKENWEIARNYDQFVSIVQKYGLDNIQKISMDHDLGETAIEEYFRNALPNYEIDYSRIEEKTGYDAAKWLVDYFYSVYPERIDMKREDKNKIPFVFPAITVHSANPIGSANIMGYINNFYKNEGQKQDCYRLQIPHS